jgi:hypothetical protein
VKLWGDAYILLVAAKFDLPPLALAAKAGDIVREVTSGTLLGEDSRGISCGAGHVEVADLVGAAREVAQGNELDGSGSCHCGGGDCCIVGVVGLEGVLRLTEGYGV